MSSFSNLVFRLVLSFVFLFSENIYDQIPSEPYYDAPYEMQSNEGVYEPEPLPPPPPPSQLTAANAANVVTINGVSIR